MEYRVRWEIDIIADTPEKAAFEAYKIQKDTISEATIFTVTKMLFNLESDPVTVDVIDIARKEKDE